MNPVKAITDTSYNHISNTIQKTSDIGHSSSSSSGTSTMSLISSMSSSGIISPLPTVEPGSPSLIPLSDHEVNTTRTPRPFLK
jgi:hypothetical protein